MSIKRLKLDILRVDKGESSCLILTSYSHCSPVYGVTPETRETVFLTPVLVLCPSQIIISIPVIRLNFGV